MADVAYVLRAHLRRRSWLLVAVLLSLTAGAAMGAGGGVRPLQVE